MQTPLTVGSLTQHRREFYTGRPIWRSNGQSSVDHPEGYLRLVDATTGALYWGHEQGGEAVWETSPLWE
jgi:hypothetical protein